MCKMSVFGLVFNFDLFEIVSISSVCILIGLVFMKQLN